MVIPVINIILKMIEQLPETEQERVVEHLREYLAELENEDKRNESFAKSLKKLVYAAREARKQIAEGKKYNFVLVPISQSDSCWPHPALSFWWGARYNIILLVDHHSPANQIHFVKFKSTRRRIWSQIKIIRT